MKSYKRIIACATRRCGQFGIKVEQEAHVRYLPHADGTGGSVEVYHFDTLLCGACDTEMEY